MKHNLLFCSLVRFVSVIVFCLRVCVFAVALLFLDKLIQCVLILRRPTQEPDPGVSLKSRGSWKSNASCSSNEECRPLRQH